MPNVTPGGNALKFYSMLRLELMPKKESKNLPSAFLMRVKQAKTKVAIPIGKDSVDIDFVYTKGFDKYFDLLCLGKDMGILRFAGSGCKVTWEDNAEEETFSSSGGMAGAKLILEADEELYQKLRNRCMQRPTTTILTEVENE